jgi:CubicO group peptidase (beta-lactamase class C family)
MVSSLRFVVTSALLCLLAGVGCGSSDGDDDPGPPDPTCTVAQREAELGVALDAVVTDADFAFAVQRADGRRYVHNRGAASLTTVYESASTSKLVTAVVILRLVEQGHLTLADHPQDHIPDWPITAGDPLRDLTLAHLLSFTSGLTSEPLCLNLPGVDFENCVGAIATANAGNGKVPGTEFHYASTHMQVAGLMAIQARGFTSWTQVFDEFRTQTGLFPTGTYDLPSAGNPRLAGGMHWTGAEYLDFLVALRGGTLLGEAAMAELLQDRTAGSVSIAYSPVTAIGEEWHYGFGFWHECASATFNCEAGVRISSPGAYGAYPFWDRRLDVVGIVAREGALQTGFEGVSVERAVRAQVEAWNNCR